MELIAENTHLVDRIAMAIDHEVNEVAKVALQTANFLAVNKNGIKVSSLFFLSIIESSHVTFKLSTQQRREISSDLE